jgi:hypothetical protein
MRGDVLFPERRARLTSECHVFGEQVGNTTPARTDTHQHLLGCRPDAGMGVAADRKLLYALIS